MYEPLARLETFHGEVPVSTAAEYFRRIYSCDFPMWIVVLQKQWPRVLRYIKWVCGKDCKTINDLAKKCEKARNHVVKVSQPAMS